MRRYAQNNGVLFINITKQLNISKKWEVYCKKERRDKGETEIIKKVNTMERNL